MVEEMWVGRAPAAWGTPRPPRWFVYGVPGTGKTSLTHLMAREMGWFLLEADALRDDARAAESGGFDRVGTTDAWRRFGDLSPETALRGLEAVRAAMQPLVIGRLHDYEGPVVVEAAFLAPEVLLPLGRLTLLVTLDESTHRQRFFRDRAEKRAESEEFEAARMLQTFLLREAHDMGVPILENQGNLKALVQAALRPTRSTPP